MRFGLFPCFIVMLYTDVPHRPMATETLSRDKPPLHFRKDAFERNGRDVVAFIHDNVSIVSYKVSHAAKANQALNHGNVDLARRSFISQRLIRHIMLCRLRNSLA
jgi:hypothetical protein